MKLQHQILTTAVALALSPAALASGAIQATDLDTIVVTATRTAINAQDSNVPVQVIDRAVIERSQATSLVDLLRGRAGINLANQGGPGKLSSVFLRGTESDHGLVLVDGIRVGSATAFSMLTVSSNGSEDATTSPLHYDIRKSLYLLS